MNSVKLAPLLLIFVEVAKKRSFTAAAKQLGLSKSAISQQIKRLEEATDQQLLVRNTRGVVLTAVGETLLARSELLSEQLNFTLTELDSAKEQPSGHFKVSVPPFFEKDIVVPALRQLSLEFPKIAPELIVTGHWQDLIENNLDAAIFGGNIKDTNYRALPIGEVSEVLCASPRYIQKQGQPANINALAQHNFIATPWQHDVLELFDEQQNKHSICAHHCAKVNTLQTVLEMTLNDMGIAFYPEFLVQPYLASKQLIQVLPTIKGKAWSFYFLHQYKGEKPIHITRFYELFRHFFYQRK
ncbi:LysR family transcriptional regulator [Marinomonas sp. 5E14-1]|uniref:LysR family transcriptional regulator n=1 Tax=Marinomonas sp. 5E14-1 TaxID=3153922 RepID=UPI00326551C9